MRRWNGSAHDRSFHDSTRKATSMNRRRASRVAFPISGEDPAVRAIGIDPGLSKTGFGVVEALPRGGKACEWGTLQTKAGCPTPLRLKIIYDGLKKLFEEWRPDLLVIE